MTTLLVCRGEAVHDRLDTNPLNDILPLNDISPPATACMIVSPIAFVAAYVLRFGQTEVPNKTDVCNGVVGTSVADDYY